MNKKRRVNSDDVDDDNNPVNFLGTPPIFRILSEVAAWVES